MKIIGNGGQAIADTSAPQYREKAEQLLKQTEENAKLRKQLAEQQAKSNNINEQQNTQITQLSAQQELLKLELENQQKAKQAQLEEERSHRFTSNASSAQSMINSEIIKVSATENIDLDSSREKITQSLNKLNSVPEQINFGPMQDSSIDPSSFTTEKLGLKELTKDESLLLTKLILNLNGIKYTETKDGLLANINSPKTSLFIPKADLNYQEAIVLNTGSRKADLYDALLADPKLTEQEAVNLVRDLLKKTGTEFEERKNTAGQTEFHFPQALDSDLSLMNKTLINGTLADNSITIPSTTELQSIDSNQRAQSRNNLLKALAPIALILGTVGTGALIVTQNPEIIGLEKSSSETRVMKEEKEELNQLKLKYPNDNRLEGSSNVSINREKGENVSQALMKIYPGYRELPRELRQQIEQTILNKESTVNDTKGYPHSSDVIQSLASSIEVPSVRDIHEQGKILNQGNHSTKKLTLTELYKTLTQTD